MRSRHHTLRLPLLFVLFLIGASGAAALAERFPGDWARFLAALVALLVFIPLANEVYVQHGAIWVAAVGLPCTVLMLWMLGMLR